MATRLGDIFESKWLSHKDFGEGESRVYTIKSVKRLSATAKFGSSPFASQDPEEIQQTWVLHFHETGKQLQLRPVRGKRIAKALGTDIIEEWVGKRIEITRGWVEFGAEEVESLIISPKAPPALAEPFKNTRLLADGRKIPSAAIGRWAAVVKGFGKTWDDFLKWAKNAHPEAFMLAFGVGLDELDMVLAPTLKAYLDFLHEKPALESSKADQVDLVGDADQERIDAAADGEVVPLDSPAGSAIPGAKRPSQADIKKALANEDDIPF